MRLREPFQGYKISSGHPMFHIAYLIGSLIATRYVMNYDEIERNEHDVAEPRIVLRQLNWAHVVVPFLNLCSYICYENGYFTID